MTQVRIGDTVKVHYTGKLEDDTIFDSSHNREPLEFTLGQAEVISGFESAVVGMNPGETKTSTVTADDAYGPYRRERVMAVGRGQFPEHIEPQVGKQLQVNQGEQQQPMIVTITEVSEDKVVLDGNHPLAGKDLTFDIQLLEIV